MEGCFKMVNTVAKGNRHQNSCRKQLEAQGYQTYVARRGFKGQAIDLFGLWDVVAYREGFILFVQVKSNYCSPSVRKPLEDWLTDGVFVRRQLWIYHDYDRSGPEIVELHGEPRECDYEEESETDDFSSDTVEKL